MCNECHYAGCAKCHDKGEVACHCCKGELLVTKFEAYQHRLYSPLSKEANLKYEALCEYDDRLGQAVKDAVGKQWRAKMDAIKARDARRFNMVMLGCALVLLAAGIGVVVSIVEFAKNGFHF